MTFPNTPSRPNSQTLENYWTISVKSVTSLNNIALEEIKQKKSQRNDLATNSESPSTRSSRVAAEIGGTSNSNSNNYIPNDSNITFSITTSSPRGSSNPQHVCPRCDKVYTYKKNLSRHLRFECGISPQEKCPYCGYLTRYKHSLNVHVRTQHPEYYNIQNKTFLDNGK